MKEKKKVSCGIFICLNLPALLHNSTKSVDTESWMLEYCATPLTPINYVMLVFRSCCEGCLGCVMLAEGIS